MVVARRFTSVMSLLFFAFHLMSISVFLEKVPPSPAAVYGSRILCRKHCLVTKRPSTKQEGSSDSRPSQSRTEITPESDDFNAWYLDVTGNAELAITVQFLELRLLDCTFCYLGGNSGGRLLHPEFYLADMDKNEAIS